MTNSSTALAVTDDPKAIAEIYGINQRVIEDSMKLEAIVERYGGPEVAKLPPMVRAVVTAKGMSVVREAMTKQLVDLVFMPLQGNKLGFRTDKDKDGGYDWDVVRDVAVEAMLRGFRMTGNEVNIIGGNFYATQEGLDRRVQEFPGLTNLSLSPGVPTLKDGGALVPYEAHWMIHGRPDSLLCNVVRSEDGEVFDHRIPVRVNAGMGADAILGKAKRKMLARIFERISGTKIADADAIETQGEPMPNDNEPTPPVAEPSQDGRRMSMGKGKRGAEKPQERPAEPDDEPMREPGEEG